LTKRRVFSKDLNDKCKPLRVYASGKKRGGKEGLILSVPGGRGSEGLFA